MTWLLHPADSSACPTPTPGCTDIEKDKMYIIRQHTCKHTYTHRHTDTDRHTHRHRHTNSQEHILGLLRVYHFTQSNVDFFKTENYTTLNRKVLKTLIDFRASDISCIHWLDKRTQIKWTKKSQNKDGESTCHQRLYGTGDKPVTFRQDTSPAKRFDSVSPSESETNNGENMWRGATCTVPSLTRRRSKICTTPLTTLKCEEMKETDKNRQPSP